MTSLMNNRDGKCNCFNNDSIKFEKEVLGNANI